MPVTILKTRNGRLDREDHPAFDQLSRRLEDSDAPLLMHLHGGLVDEDAGTETARRLSGKGANSYDAPDTYEQLYIVWRSGLLETLGTNWRELHKRDRLYRALLGKLLEFIAKRVGFSFPDILGGSESLVDTRFGVEQRLAFGSDMPFAELDAFLAANPLAAESLADPAFEADLERELSADPGLIAAAQDLEAALSTGAESLNAFGDEAVGKAALLRLNPEIVRDLRTQTLARSGAEGFGFSVLKGIVVHGVKIGRRVWKRMRSGRDHGVHATIIEEILRELYGDYIGSAIWTLMKADTADHFKGRFGTQLLDLLERTQQRKVVVVGHSAGAIFVCHMLIDWANRNTGRTMDVVMLAPAVRNRLFAETLDQASGSIDRFRMFCLGEDRERANAVMGDRFRFLYPSSLLYLVSGVFEDDAQEPHVDAPLLGMERFQTWGGGSLGDVEDGAAQKVRAYFGAVTEAEIYAPSARGTGLSSDATTHDGIDNDAETLASVRTFL
ncbi:MAG: alpha/beta hydrolase [Erythrobacter sp.]